MIIVVCTDDNQLLNVARQQAQNNRNIFGQCYWAFNDQIPQIIPNENLFISAHGAYRGDDGNPVIGDRQSAFYVNAVDFYENIQVIFPNNYQANVYISACESSDIARGSFSFAEVFKAQIQVAHGNTRVYGQRGAVGLQIPLPNDPNPNWVQA